MYFVLFWGSPGSSCNRCFGWRVPGLDSAACVACLAGAGARRCGGACAGGQGVWEGGSLWALPAAGKQTQKSHAGQVSSSSFLAPRGTVAPAGGAPARAAVPATATQDRRQPVSREVHHNAPGALFHSAPRRVLQAKHAGAPLVSPCPAVAPARDECGTKHSASCSTAFLRRRTQPWPRSVAVRLQPRRDGA